MSEGIPLSQAWRQFLKSREGRRLSASRHAFTVSEFCDAYGLGRTRLFEEIKSGRLLTYTVGRRRFISVSAAELWQRRLEAAAIKADLDGEASYDDE